MLNQYTHQWLNSLSQKKLINLAATFLHDEQIEPLWHDFLNEAFADDNQPDA